MAVVRLKLVHLNVVESGISVCSIMKSFYSGFSRRIHLNICIFFSNSLCSMVFHILYGHDTWSRQFGELRVVTLFYTNTDVEPSLKSGVTKFGPGGPVSLQSLAPTLIKHT